MAGWAPLVQPVVVVPPGGPGRIAGVGTVVDPDGALRRTWQPGVHLVRPDVHLAATGPRAVQAHLQRVYGRPAGYAAPARE